MTNHETRPRSEKRLDSERISRFKEADKFLSLIDPSAKHWCFQIIGHSGEHKTPAKTIHGTLTHNLGTLTDLNRQGAGIFVTVNEVTPGEKRKAENITRVRACFADFDRDNYPEQYPIPPHIIVESSPKKRHVYWIVDGMPLEDFKAQQLGIADALDSDPSVSDLPRVMRLPGFDHTKDAPNRYRVRIISTNNRPPYTPEEIAKAFPPLANIKGVSGTPDLSLDPIVQALQDQGLILGSRNDGGFNITCPWENEHTTPSSKSSTVYYPAHTGGYVGAGFKCQHAHCVNRTIQDLKDWLGLEADEGQAPLSKLTEDALALTFVDQNEGLRYVAAWGKWMHWNGQYWEDDDTKKTTDIVRRTLRQISRKSGGKQRRRLESKNTVSNVETLARSDRRIAAITDQWDKNPLLLNTPSGVIDLETGTNQAHNPNDYMTKITAAAPSGDCPRWRSFLDEITNGDNELASYLQRVAGYSVTGLIREHALFFFYGTGANGKGTFLNMLQWLFGRYAVTASADTFTVSPTTQHPTDLAMMRGARMVVAQETEEGQAWAESKIKALTGGDPITARFMRQDFFTFEPQFTLLIASNHKPRLRNIDEAIRRRLHMIPFTVTIPPEKRDNRLSEALKQEAAGIMRWVVDGARVYFCEGLNPPRAVTEATSEYLEDQDLFSQWFEDHCETGPGYQANPRELFSSWKCYAETLRIRPGLRSEFKDRLTMRGIVQQRNGRERFYPGVRLREVPPIFDPLDWDREAV